MLSRLLRILPLFVVFFSLNFFFEPTPASAALVPCGRSSGTAAEQAPCTVCHVIVGGKGLIDWGMEIMTIIAITVIVAMGLFYILSAGNDGLMKTAKAGIKAALTGFAVMLTAWLLVNLVLTLLVDSAKTESPFHDLIEQGTFRFTCGGSGVSQGTPPAEMPPASSPPPVSQAFETVIVSPAPLPGAIVTTPTLFLKDGTEVKKVEGIPEGIETSPWMKAGEDKKPLHIIFEPGLYELTSSWIWTGATSGTEKAPIVVEARVPGSVIISGGVALPPVPVSGGKVSVDAASAGVGNFEQLWVNGTRATRARTPNGSEFFYVGKKVESYDGQNMIGGVTVEKQAFTSEKKVIDILAALSNKDKKDGIVVVAESWTTGHHHIVSWNKDTNDILVSPPALRPFTHFGLAQRFFLENIESALDQPGEWYVDENKKVSYLPRGSDGGRVKMVLPRLEKLLVLKGSSGKKVSHLEFKGLAFQYAAYPLPQAGFTDWQAAMPAGEAISIDYADTVNFSDCELSHVGAYGFSLNTKARNVTITNCEIFDTGAGAVRVGSSSVADSAADGTGFLTLSQNRIHATGFEFPGAPAVVILKSSDNTVIDNTIGDTTYSGISIGWQWDNKEPSTSARNKIKRNFLYDIGQSSLTDMGGIYTLGNSPGTELTGNVIRNVRGFWPDGAGAFGIYNDQGSSNILVEGNIVSDTDSGSYFSNTQALGNILKRNAFSAVPANKSYMGTEVMITDNTTSVTGNVVNILENYIFPAKNAFLRISGTQKAPVTFDGNALSNQYLGTVVSPSVCGAGCAVDTGLVLNKGSLYETPRVLQNGTSVFAAQDLAFFSKGSLTPVLSPSLLWSESPDDIRVPQLPFEVETAALPIGAAMPRFEIYPLNSHAVSVQNVDGEKCFAFQDGPNMVNSYEPFAQAAVSFYEGVMQEHFRLKLQKDGSMTHELRSEAGGGNYTSGPVVSFDVKKGIVASNGTTNVSLGSMPLGEWVDVDIRIDFSAGPKYSIEITYQSGAKTNKQNLAPKSTDWKKVGGIFFISSTTALTTTCVDNISARILP